MDICDSFIKIIKWGSTHFLGTVVAREAQVKYIINKVENKRRRNGPSQKMITGEFFNGYSYPEGQMA